MSHSIFTPAGGPPRVTPPAKAIIDAMGEEGWASLLWRFYQLLAKSSVAHLFPGDEQALKAASQRSAAFFIQVCGGPPRYNERYGPPMLRKRHLPFPIDQAAREAWLACYYEALDAAPDKEGFPVAEIGPFKEWLAAFSGWMVNRQ